MQPVEGMITPGEPVKGGQKLNFAVAFSGAATLYSHKSSRSAGTPAVGLCDAGFSKGKSPHVQSGAVPDLGQPEAKLGRAPRP